MNRVYLLDKDTNITYYLVGVKTISPNMGATLTEYPVPEGTFITDYSYKNSDSLSLSAISDGFDVIRKSYYVDIDGKTQNLTYEMFKDLLNTWIKEATRFDIQTVHGLFRSMVLIGVNWSEGKDSWSMFSPTLEFKEARIAQITTTDIKALNVSYGADYTKEESTTGEDNGTEVTSSSVIGSTLGLAAVGAGIGSIFGPVGTAVGAVGGAVIGFFKSIF